MLQLTKFTTKTEWLLGTWLLERELRAFRLLFPKYKVTFRGNSLKGWTLVSYQLNKIQVDNVKMYFMGLEP